MRHITWSFRNLRSVGVARPVVGVAAHLYRRGCATFTSAMESLSYVGAIDQGTTSTRFIVYDKAAREVASHQLEFEQIHPQAGWVEHDPMAILAATRTCMSEAVSKAEAAGIPLSVTGLKAIGITNQRETTVVWSKTTGRPFHNALVWMDVRTSGICRRLEQELAGGKEHFRKTTGLPISTYFSAVKLMWLLENVPSVGAAAASGDALFGTIDTWLIWNLTGGTQVPEGSPSVSPPGLHVTDCSNASRTMLMDLTSLTWHQPTLDTLRIPATMLPTIVSNAEVIGTVSPSWPLSGTPLAGCLGDQHAAMLGQKCRPGEAKATFGTGCFILFNTGNTIHTSLHGLLSTLSFKLGPQAATCYALEGSIAAAGAAVQWLRDSLGIIQSASEVESLAASVESTGGVYFVPAFSGLFAPRWRDDARGVCVGLTRHTGKAHIARAVLESMCFQVCDVLQAMHADLGSAANPSDNRFLLRVDGGASVNNLLMQLQADLLGSTVLRSSYAETTALGAAFAAGVAVGVWTEDEVFGGGVQDVGTAEFNPRIGEEEREKRLASWSLAVERSLGLAELA